MTEQERKTREHRLRRMAGRQGLVLRRSARRDPLAIDYGVYWLYRSGALITPQAGMALDEIEQFLTTPADQRGVFHDPEGED